MDRSERRTLLAEFFVVFAVATATLTALLVFIDNTNLVTTNGLWKSIQVKGWVDGGPYQMDEANLAYYPASGFLIRLFPEDIFGPVWRRMAFLNAIWAGMAIAFLYVLLRGLRLPRGVAAAGALFQMGCAFFYALAITSEDIMAGVAFLFAAMAFAVLVARRPTAWGVAIVSLTFTTAWFFEWRLMFPTAPALLLVLLTLPGSWAQRSRWIVVAIVTSLIPPALMAGLGHYHGRYTGVFDGIASIFWTGKGVGTGWGGFSMAKLWFMASGVGYYVLQGCNVSQLTWFDDPWVRVQLGLALAMIAVLLVVFVRGMWARRADPSWRAAGLVLGGTLAFGQFFNFYSQPQDPQMQINVMVWLPVAWAIVCAKFATTGVRRMSLGLLTIVPLLVNTVYFAAFRGGDSEQLYRVEKLASVADPAQCLFVEHGFEGLITWRAVTWDWDTTSLPLDRPPQTRPLFKLECLASQATMFPERLPKDSADAVCAKIDDAMARGFRVVMNHCWEWTEAEFISNFATVSGPEKPRAIRAALKDRYRADLLIDDPMLGRYFELHPK